MTRIAARLGLLLLLAAAMVSAVPSSASAGGPTSVLITDPARHRTASAAAGDDRYQQLAAAIGYDPARGAELPSAGESPPSGFGAIFRSDLRVTWLAHDTTIWRIDLIFFIRDSVWIATGRSWITEPDQAVWHRVADPDRLRSVLAEAGLVPRSASPSAATTSAPSDPVAGSALIGGPALLGPVCAVVGVLLGIGAALLPSRGDRKSTQVEKRTPSSPNTAQKVHPGRQNAPPREQPDHGTKVHLGRETHHHPGSPITVRKSTQVEKWTPSSPNTAQKST
ncbi:hypothetical protein [Microlunatus speluncae]|uniref:hypothetical protein n=1 Tax=Microlunatus speluncae TaxID=2594267 RepID=UPI0013755FB2|nr:hypothetical protein [Microlunatus speluncae]